MVYYRSYGKYQVLHFVSTLIHFSFHKSHMARPYFCHLRCSVSRRKRSWRRTVLGSVRNDRWGYLEVNNYEINKVQSYNNLRGCFEQDRFTWKVLWQAFPGFQRVLQAIQWHHNKTTKNCRATHFHKCCLRAVFTTKNFVKHLSYSLTFNVSVIFCLTFPSQNFVVPLLSHFPNTFQQNSIQFIKLPPKSCKRLQIGASEKNRKAAVSARVPPGKLQFLQECFLHLEQSRFEAAPWENVRQ